MRTPRLLAGGLALALLAPWPARAQDGTCRRDLLVAESLQRTAIDRLEATGTGEAAQCAAWRQHVATMRRAAAIYGRCLAGEARGAKVAETEGAAAEFDGLVRQRCRGR
jgi:hypothetical protein